jgi:hypothetical protein
MVWILLGIFIGVPALIFGSALISVKIDDAKQKKQEEERLQIEVNNTYNQILQANYRDSFSDSKGSIKELPQMTFERWLTFYNTNPNNWDMEKFTTHIEFSKRNSSSTCYDYLIPTYYKTTVHKGHDGRVREIKNVVGIPIFWSSPEEMVKFDHWFKNEYKKGNAAGYERKRDEAMEQLAKYLQEDVNERRAQILRDYEAIVDKTQQVKVEGSNITLDLNSPRTVEERANDLLNTLITSSSNN